MKANSVGPKQLYLNPSSIVAFTTADIGLIDSAISSSASSIAPHAYTATVRDDYDTRNVFINGQDLLTAQRLSYGLFLSPDNHKKNLLWQLSGMLSLSADGADGNKLQPKFFFGRKATNNTVVSSLVASTNGLDKYMILAPTVYNQNYDDGSAVSKIDMGIEIELFTLEEAAAFVYVFGIMIDNSSAATFTIKAHSSLSMRKQANSLPNFEPSFL